MTTVQGYCPMGCGRTLFLDDAGYIICSLAGCPNPLALADIIAENQLMHVVTLRDDTFTIRHPLRERLGVQLEGCGLHAHLAGLDGPPRKPGKYLALEIPSESGQWTWRELVPAEGAKS